MITKLDLMDEGTDAKEILENRLLPLRRGKEMYDFGHKDGSKDAGWIQSEEVWGGGGADNPHGGPRCPLAEVKGAEPIAGWRGRLPEKIKCFSLGGAWAPGAPPPATEMPAFQNTNVLNFDMIGLLKQWKTGCYRTGVPGHI